MAREHVCSLCNVDNPRVQAWMTTVSQFIFFRSKTDLVYRHEWLCRSGNGHGGSILTPQAENKNCQSVGTCSTWKMQSWLENTSVAFAMCIVQQSHSRYRIYVVRGRLHRLFAWHGPAFEMHLLCDCASPKRSKTMCCTTPRL